MELDNLDVKILSHLLENSRKSFQEIAKQCLTSVPTVKSRVERLIELGVIRRFTIDIDGTKLGIQEAMLVINAKPEAVNRIANELAKVEEVRELYVTSDSDAALVSRISGEMQRLLAIQDRLNLADVNNPRIIPIKSTFKNSFVPLASRSITITAHTAVKR